MDLAQYNTELLTGGGTLAGGLLIAILKILSKKLNALVDRVSKLEGDVRVNTALDKERNKNN